MGKSAVIAGASGLTGSELVRLLLADERYDTVTAIVRSPLGLEDKKLIQKKVDFEHLDEDLKGIKADHAFCCLGTTIKKAGSKESQYRADHDYVTDFASCAFREGIRRFAVVSSSGANSRSANFYLRTKGEMEDDLKKIPFEGLYIFRPSLLMGRRKEFRLGELAAKGIMKVLNPLMAGRLKRYRGIYASEVARAMIRYANSDISGISVIESEDIRG